MKYLRCFIRLALIAFLLACAIVVSLVYVILGHHPNHRHENEWRIIKLWMRYFCRIIGLRIHVSGQAPVGPALLVANHISWHDIVTLQSLVSTGFVAKHELKSWPLIGWLAYHWNTLFIRRGKRKSLEQIHTAMMQRFTDNQSIMLFPEGTTTTGESVKPFRSRLLDTAINLELPIQPVAIWYSSPTMQCHELAFVGDESFVSHGLRTLGEHHIDVYVHFCEPVASKKDDDWRELGRQAQQLVEKQLSSIIKKHS